MTAPAFTFKKTPSSSIVRRDGFALLITVTLLAFLVLLLVSLAALTRVETQVASNTQQIAQARQNALMALNIALGELQKYVGPDQRTTALADLDNTLANTAAKSGRWLGAYGSGVAASYADTPTQIADKLAADAATGPGNGSQARLLNWLVSGNEGTDFNPQSAVAADGHVNTASASTSFQFKPEDTVAGLKDTSTALSIDITVAGQPARLLVGPNTVGPGNDAASLSTYVVAPLKEISAVVPGLGASALPVGRYAWWVGDEGAKARINLPMATSAQAGNAFVSAQRTAVELVDANNRAASTTLLPGDMLDPTGALSRYNPSGNVSSLISHGQLPMLSTPAATVLRQTARYRFHDLTASSSSVLSDTYAGGLKKDLSALLASDATSPAPTNFLFQPEPDPEPWVKNSDWVPTWGHLRSFASTTVQPDGKLSPRTNTDSQSGIYPVLTHAAVGFQYTSGGATGDPIHLALFPIVVLWNPYTVPIKADKYEFGVIRRDDAMIQLQAHTPWKISPWTVKDTRDFRRGGASIPTPAPGTFGVNTDGSANAASTSAPTPSATDNTYLRFVIDASDMDLPAGQSMIFTLPSAGQTYEAPENGVPTNVLKAGLRAADDAYALMPSVSSIDANETLFRVGIHAKSPDYLDIDHRTIFSPAPARTHFSSGQIDVYLGPVSEEAPVGYGPGPGRSWYQMYGVTPGKAPGPTATYPGDGNEYSLVLQGGIAGAPLSNHSPQPEFMLSLKHMFSRDVFLRWIAQANARAHVHTSNRLDQRRLVATSMEGGQWPSFTVDPSGRVSSGFSLDAVPHLVDTTLFEYRPADRPLLSLGQLQHANLSLIQSYPSYPLGNSLADYRFKGSAGDYLDRLVRTDGTTINEFQAKHFLIQVFASYDISYLLNRTMWDRHFVSTVPNAGTGIHTDTSTRPIPSILPNPRHVLQTDPGNGDLRDANKAAAHLMLAGGFNINSTSEQAWRAVLGGINQLPYDPESANGGTPLRSALPRFSKPTLAADSNSSSWQGYRQLTDLQIAHLARNIVAEIRSRGPFVSMSDFINRRLRDNPNTTSTTFNADERVKGAIQNAIDATGTLSTSGDKIVSGIAAINAGTPGPVTPAAPFTIRKEDNTLLSYSGKVGAAAYSDAKVAAGGPVLVSPYGTPSAFAPQFLTQADALSAIGAGLSARSDTFAIRTCGETVNPALGSTEAGYVTGRAWCEAIVQRVVEPLRRKGATTSSPDYNEPAMASSGQPDLGRRFKVVSFRWLSANDI